MLLPTRAAVLNYLYSVKSVDTKEITEALKPQHGGERQFIRERYLDHVMSLGANDLLNLESYKLGEVGGLPLRRITDEDGEAMVGKYVSKKYRQRS